MQQGGRLGVSHGWERIDPTVRGGGRSPVAADAGLIDDNRGLARAISRGVQKRTAVAAVNSPDSRHGRVRAVAVQPDASLR